jgi:hypothetical protein
MTEPAIRSLDSSEIRSVVDGPELIVLGLDLEERALRQFEGAARLLPGTSFVQSMIKGAPTETAALFGNLRVDYPRILLVRAGVLMREIEGWKQNPGDVVEAVRKAQAIGIDEARVRATAWQAEPGPAEGSFEEQAIGTYRAGDDLGNRYTLELGDGGRASREEAQSGCSSTTLRGAWKRAGERILEFQWTVREDDSASARDRMQAKGRSTVREQVEFGWKSGRVHEIRFSVGRLPSFVPPKIRYLRT